MNCDRKRVKRSQNASVKRARMDYRERLLNAMEQIRGEALRGHVSAVNVRHDAWCHLLNRRGACNCVPDMSLTCKDGVFTIDRQGNARRNGCASGRTEG